MNEQIKPIEEVDPIFADLIYDVANKKYKYGVKAIVDTGNDIHFIPSPIKSIKIGRNDPCTCGSGKKYKKCCGKLK